MLRGVDLDVVSGDGLGILGRNGVGKSTLVKCLMGYLQVTGGRAEFEQTDLSGIPTHERRRMGIVYGPQEGVVFDNLSVRDNLLVHRKDRDLGCYEQMFEFFPRVRERLNQRAGVLSGGEKKLVSFCRVMAEQARLVILDEPTEGVAPENIALMSQLIKDRQGVGSAFVVVEQNLTFVGSFSTRVLALDHGEVVLSGSAQGYTRADLERVLQV